MCDIDGLNISWLICSQLGLSQATELFLPHLHCPTLWEYRYSFHHKLKRRFQVYFLEEQLNNYCHAKKNKHSDNKR